MNGNPPFPIWRRPCQLEANRLIQIIADLRDQIAQLRGDLDRTKKVIQERLTMTAQLCTHVSEIWWQLKTPPSAVSAELDDQIRYYQHVHESFEPYNAQLRNAREECRESAADLNDAFNRAYADHRAVVSSGRAVNIDHAQFDRIGLPIRTAPAAKAPPVPPSGSTWDESRRERKEESVRKKKEQAYDRYSPAHASTEDTVGQTVAGMQTKGFGFFL
jgi:prefoldin subunit 5